MTEIEIYENGKMVSIPSSWDEMTPEQVCHVFRVYDQCVRKGVSPLEFNVRVLFYLLGIKVGRFREAVRSRVFPARMSRKAENVYMLCEQCLGFMFSRAEDAPGPVLSFDSLRNPLPVIRLSSGCKLHGPADMLSDLTFGEFRHASVCLNEFFKTKEVSQLDECIAHLYRRRSLSANLAGRCVEPLDNKTAAAAIKRASKVVAWQKSLIMMWFSACLKYLQTGKVVIDGEEVDMSQLFSKEEGYRQHNRGYSWNDLLIEIAKEQTIGNMERVDEEPLYSIFSIMWHNYKERKRYEKIAKTK